MSLKPFPVTEAQIVSLFMESVFYGTSHESKARMILTKLCAGIYLVTLGLCLRVLLFERQHLVFKCPRDINWGMLLVAFLLATFSTFEGDYCFSYSDSLRVPSLTVSSDCSCFRPEAQFGCIRVIHRLWRSNSRAG